MLAGRFTLLVTGDILLEYTEVIQRRASVAVAGNIADFLTRSPDVELVDVYFKWSIMYDDQDDDKFVDCALNGNANLLVTR